MIAGIKSNVLRWCLGAILCAAVPAMTACVTGRPAGQESGETAPTFVEKIEVLPAGERMSVEITCSEPVPYSAFKLLDPSRIVLDVMAPPARQLPGTVHVGEGLIDRIVAEDAGERSPTTRVTVFLEADVDYGVVEKEANIVLSLFPHGMVSESPRLPEFQAAGTAGPAGPETAAGRIFFPARPEPLNLVRGLDFRMLEERKSRLIVTSSGKAEHSVRRVGDKGVLLSLENSTIPDLLKREIDARYFEGVIEKAVASFAQDDSRVDILLTLKEMVPYHVTQDENEIRMDFYKTTVQPARAELKPVRTAIPPEKPGEPALVPAPLPRAEDPANTGVSEAEGLTGPGMKKEYTGTPMTMEFVDADVTNILRLIGEVSNLNIIWGPDVTGTVSMRLRKVPWDQALDLVLANNDLSKEVRGNVIWVTTRIKMEELRAAERRAQEEEREREREERELEPLITEYFPVDFASAAAVKEHFEKVKTERGVVSVDDRTNTVIMRDTTEALAEAEKILQRFDTPVKQIMIEARIVDARTDFSRDLGVQWDTGTSFERALGRSEYGGSFATNSPVEWTSNIGLEFVRRTTQGLVELDARLALAESEGKASVISAPRVIASNGEEAVISRGEVVFREVVTQDQIDVKELEAVLSLTVTPTVSFNDFVTMKLEVTDDGFLDVDTKTEKRIETTLMVRSGETIVIGGIYTEENSEWEEGIPVLRNIPGLGWLFKARRIVKERTELLIFITPRVIEPARPEGRAL